MFKLTIALFVALAGSGVQVAVGQCRDVTLNNCEYGNWLERSERASEASSATTSILCVVFSGKTRLKITSVITRVQKATLYQFVHKAQNCNVVLLSSWQGNHGYYTRVVPKNHKWQSHE
jgi:hypothetical protein